MTVRHATATLLTDRLISVAPAAVGRPLTAGIQLGGTDIFLVIGAIGPSSGPVLYGAALPRCRVPRHGDSDPTTATSGESLFVGALASLMFVQMGERTLGEVTTSMTVHGDDSRCVRPLPVLIQRRRLATLPAG